MTCQRQEAILWRTHVEMSHVIFFAPGCPKDEKDGNPDTWAINARGIAQLKMFGRFFGRVDSHDIFYLSSR